MQTPGRLDLDCYQGASFDCTLTWRMGATPGTPVNLTGYTARMQVRDGYDGGSAIVSLTSGTGITLGGTAGTILLELTPTQTAAIDATPSGQYVYDLELVSGSTVTRLVQGTFIVSPEVTR
jgi:hypothetical protein